MTSQELLISIGEMLEAKISPLREDIREVRQDMSDVKQDICVMKQEMGSMRQEIDGMKQEIVSLKQDMGVMRQEIDFVKEETGSMRSEVSSLREEMDAVKQRLILIETTLENETNRGIRIIAEGHLDLSRKQKKSENLFIFNPFFDPRRHVPLSEDVKKHSLFSKNEAQESSDSSAVQKVSAKRQETAIKSARNWWYSIKNVDILTLVNEKGGDGHADPESDGCIVQGIWQSAGRL